MTVEPVINARRFLVTIKTMTNRITPMLARWAQGVEPFWYDWADGSGLGCYGPGTSIGAYSRISTVAQGRERWDDDIRAANG